VDQDHDVNSSVIGRGRIPKYLPTYVSSQMPHAPSKCGSVYGIYRYYNYQWPERGIMFVCKLPRLGRT